MIFMFIFMSMTSILKVCARASALGVVYSLIGAATMLCACGGTSASSDVEQGDTLRLKYSRLLTIVRHEGYTTVDIDNPWNRGTTLHRYVLIGKDKDVSTKIQRNATLVRIPLSQTVVFSEVHAALIGEMGQNGAIAGLADVMYYSDSDILENLKNGRYTDVGLAANPDIERIIDLSPDALLVSPFENSGGYGKLEQMGVPLIECADYMECSPLARAEWIRFYGMLYGAESKADSLFAAVDSTYNALKACAAKAANRPKVMIDKLTGATWYVPGGGSTMGQMLADAGMNYIFDGYSTSSGSLPMAFETVLDHCTEADLWLFRHNSAGKMTYDALLSENAGYAHFRPFQRRKCFACNTITSGFFTQTPFHPERLLVNLISIAHPELIGNAQSKLTNSAGNTYFRPVEESK